MDYLDAHNPYLYSFREQAPNLVATHPKPPSDRCLRQVLLVVQLSNLHQR
jgi:hypothetical protein